MKKIEEKAKENTAEADYSDRIIKQADERVQQAIEDRNRIIAEWDAAYAKAIDEQKYTKEWREKYYSEQETRHVLEIKLKDAEIRATEERNFRCELNDCPKRKPPRKRIQIVEKSKKQENGKEKRKDDAARVTE